MADSGNTYSKNYGVNRFWFIPPLLFVGAMGGMIYYGYKTYFQPKATFYQTDQPKRTLKATAVESEEEKQIKKTLDEGASLQEGTIERMPAGEFLQTEIRMTQNNEGVVYEIDLQPSQANDVKVVVTARQLEVSAKSGRKEVLLPKGVDHTRAEITKKDGKWIVKLPRA